MKKFNLLETFSEFGVLGKTYVKIYEVLLNEGEVAEYIMVRIEHAGTHVVDFFSKPENWLKKVEKYSRVLRGA